MKYIIKLVFVCSLLWCESSLASIDPQWNGHFRVEQFGEKLIDGSQVLLQYDITINNSKESASMDMITWHAPINCIGDYTLKNNNNVLEMHYSTQNKNYGCIYPSPQFELKKNGGRFYIRGRVLAYSSGEWILLKKMAH